MSNVLDRKTKAYELLKEYQGQNPYIIQLKNSVYAYKSLSLNDFHAEFIIENYNFEPRFVGRVVKIAPWFGKKKQEELNLGFTPEVMQIGYYLGQAKGVMVFYARYRQTQEKGILTFATQEAIFTDFTATNGSELNIDFTPYNETSGRILKPHQEEGIKFLIAKKKCILADDMGLGKTTQLTVASLVGQFKHILIICPASVKKTWKDELMIYVPEKDISIIDSFQPLNKSQLEESLGYTPGSSGKKREELLQEAKEKGKWRSNKYTIINFDILDEFYKIPKETVSYMESDVDIFGNVIKVQKQKEVVSRKRSVIDLAMAESQLYLDNFDLVIIDEAHKLSNKSSERTKIVQDLLKRSNPKAVWCSTGTPITNSPYNFYNILKIIDAPISRKWEEYVMKYCDGRRLVKKDERNKWTVAFLKMKGKEYWKDLTDKEKEELEVYIDKNAKSIILHSGATNLEELKERVKGYYLRRKKEDLNHMVQKTVKLLQYELPEQDRLEYDVIIQDFKDKMKAKGASASEMIEGIVAQQWLAKKMVPHTIRLANQHIRNGEKVIIFCCFDDELYKLKEYYGDQAVIFNGKLSSVQKEANKQKFIKDPECKVFIGNITAASLGLTLVVATVSIFNNFSWQSGENGQAEDRIWRLNQTKDCTVYYQTFQDTYYTEKFYKVQEKQRVIDEIIVKENDK